MYYDQNRRIFQCNSCGKDIRFSEFETSISSKRIPPNTKTEAHHRCKAKPFNRETRRQWWDQQKKAEQQRQRNKQDHSYRLLSLSKHSEYAKTLGVAINATARRLKKHIKFKISHNFK
jgi:NADH:ubiquinone oxidoreductase subunit